MENENIFENDWEIGSIKINRNIRSIVTLIIWFITGIIFLIDFILALTIDNKWVIFVLYIIGIIPSLLTFVKL